MGGNLTGLTRLTGLGEGREIFDGVNGIILWIVIRWDE
jgi:hypothetical protein